MRSSHENKFCLQQIKQTTPPPTPEEEILPPPPVAARPEKTKSIVSTNFIELESKQLNSNPNIFEISMRKWKNNVVCEKKVFLSIWVRGKWVRGQQVLHAEVNVGSWLPVGNKARAWKWIPFAVKIRD